VTYLTDAGQTQVESPPADFDEPLTAQRHRSPILHRGTATVHRAATGVRASVVVVADVWVVLGIVGFVAAMLWLIRGLERI
jgi:hypothetical protein